MTPNPAVERTFAKSGAGRSLLRYAAPEAARILDLPVSAVRNRAFGQSGRLSSHQRARFAAVIPAADPQRRLLSFANLCELHVLSAIRREHRVSLPTVRKSLDYVSRQLGAERPLLERVFLTNGVSLFVEHAAELVNVSQHGQTALRGEFQRALARIERDGRGRPVRLFPFTRSNSARSSSRNNGLMSLRMLASLV